METILQEFQYHQQAEIDLKHNEDDLYENGINYSNNQIILTNGSSLKITSIKYFNNKFNNFKKNTNKHNALLLKK